MTKSQKSSKIQSPNPKQPSSAPDDVKTSKRAGRYVAIGISLTIFNYVVYAVLANLIINNNDLLWLSTFISTALTTVLAYILHSRITWKERGVTKTSIVKFFIWNAVLAVAVGPELTQLFSYLTPLYDFAFSITDAMHIPFTYDFVLTTGAFVLTSIVTMVLNYLFYDKFVFGQSKSSKSSK